LTTPGDRTGLLPGTMIVYPGSRPGMTDGTADLHSALAA